jgi:hypothetical protein
MTSYVRVLEGAFIALALAAASAVAHANLAPGIGAQVGATDNKGTGNNCVTAFMIPSASCSIGMAGASATMQNTVDITVYAGGGSWSAGIIQETLFFQGVPANPADWITLRMRSSGTVAGLPNQDYAGSEFSIGGFVGIPGVTPANMLGIMTGSNVLDSGSAYDPGSKVGTPFGITAYSFSDGAHMEAAWSFPAAFAGPAGIEVRLMLTCTALISCSYTDPFTITLPAGMTFTSASGQFLVPVPEPSAAWLFAAGLLCVAGTVWARRSPAARLWAVRGS